ncbi:MAG: SagB/ThcOx family dehydrogenase [Planctomycetes bacterium]|nr:SagB/ThcOx family dehydrogenase [Planctomycetota bacterium]
MNTFVPRALISPFILCPVALFIIYFICRLLLGQPLKKRSLNIGFSLLLLVYFLGTAGFGIFWVAQHELPVFDLHYLFGYITLALVVIHLAFNWKSLIAFFTRHPVRQNSAQEKTASKYQAKVFFIVIGLIFYGSLIFFIGRNYGTKNIHITMAKQPNIVSQPAGTAQSAQARAVTVQHQMIKDTGRELKLAEYYHEQTKHSRMSLMLNSRGLDWSTQPAVFKQYPDAEVFDLPEPRKLAGMSVGQSIELSRRMVHGFANDGISIQELSTLLYMTNGVTGSLSYPGLTYYLRAAPSAGALYPTVTYIIVKNVEGLTTGLYHYRVKDHKLHRLKANETIYKDLAKLVPQSDVIESAPVTFVFTTIFFRTSWKYEQRSYRYSCLDAGHLAVQTMLAANSLNYGAKLIGRFDDAKVNSLLGLNEQKEGTLLIVPIGKIAEAPPSSTERAAFTLQPHQFEGKGDKLIKLIHGATFFSKTNEMVQPFPKYQPIDKPYVNFPIIHLPKQFNAGDDLYPTILRRRSARRWTQTPMTLEELSSVLYYTFGIRQGAESTFPDPSVENHHALHLYLIINNVKGIERGIYYYRRNDHALTQIRKGDYQSTSYAMSLFQEVVGSSDVAIVMTIDSKLYGRLDADRGYRYAAFDAGMLGGRLYLQTTGLDLGCCGIGAFFDNEVSQAIKVDPDKELIIYMAAIGTKKE